MFDFQATIDKVGVMSLLKVEKQIPFAVAVALTRTAQSILAAERDLLISSLDNPTAYTKNSLRFTRATKDNLEASVGTKQPTAGNTNPASFLAPEIEGGKRSTKRFELLLQAAGLMPKGWRAVPARGVPLDAFGNLSRATIGKLLKGLKSQFVMGPTAPTKKGKAAKVKQSPYFVLRQQSGNKPPGIWERKASGDKRTVEPIVIYVSEASYQKRLDFYGKAQGMVDGLMEKNFAIELQKAIDSAK